MESIIILAISLYEEFSQCHCENCRNGNSWLEIFSSLKAKPHFELLNKALCPRIYHPDLSMKDECPFSLHKWECAKSNCNQCGAEKLLPFDCPVIKTSSRKVKVWTWDKATGDNERTVKTEMALKDVFRELQISLIEFAAHIIPMQLWNQMRHLAVHHVIDYPLKVIAFSDFSSQMDLEPVRKVNCHVNKHASLGIFVLFFQDNVIIHDEEVKFIACREWFIFGSCEEKGKQNDWIFHNGANDYIIDYYGLLKTLWEIWTDNCPGQVCQ